MLFEHGVERVLRGFDEVSEFAADFAYAGGVPDVMGGFDEDLGVLLNDRISTCDKTWSRLGMLRGKKELTA